MGLSCGRNQNCIPYGECPSALKIARGILITANVTEKYMLTEKFRQLQCGNYSTEKTVCCDQDNTEGKIKTVQLFFVSITRTKIFKKLKILLLTSKMETLFSGFIFKMTFINI